VERELMGAVYLVRHGQASFGAEDYDVLSEQGRLQARVLGEALAQRLPALDAVLMGTHRRHHETALACLQALPGAPEPLALDEFDEFDHEEVLLRFAPRFADRQVLAAELAAASDPRRAFQDVFSAAVARWAGGGHDPDYRETWSSFRARCSAAMDQAAAAMGPARTVLVFTSGGVIGAVAQALLGLSDPQTFRLTWTLANCGVTKVVCGSRERYLSTLNEHVHFEGARRSLLTYR
jgi:broad specificity phosphatase PhoE